MAARMTVVSVERRSTWHELVTKTKGMQAVLDAVERAILPQPLGSVTAGACSPA
jgi:hypothetical protein